MVLRQKLSSTEKQNNRHLFLFRFFPLLLLMVYAAFSVGQLHLPSPWDSNSSLLHPPDHHQDRRRSADYEEIVGDMSLRTHFWSSKDLQLRADEEQSKQLPSPSPEKTNSCSYSFQSDVFRREGSTAMLCCDRTHYRTNVCYLRGDIRTSSATKSIFIYGGGATFTAAPETIRPYTRKWETGVMNTIDELTILPDSSNSTATATTALPHPPPECEVDHRGSAPAVVFSTGGYTGNVYHEFNDGLIPLYITASELAGDPRSTTINNMVAVVLDYHPWWYSRYEGVIKELTKHDPVDFNNDLRIHCFSEMIVGLKIHGELTVDPLLMPKGRSMHDFQGILHRGFGAATAAAFSSSYPCKVNCQTRGTPPSSLHKPKIVIFVRSKSRVLKNLREVIRWSKRIGFEVVTVNPTRETPVSEIYSAVNSAAVMIAVHGAAATHFLFMRPGSVLIQIIPLGLDWPAREYYGDPSRRLGLRYLEYRVSPKESSLYKEYDRDDPVLVNPNSVTSKGWWETKKVYLDRQNVRVDIKKFVNVLKTAYSHVCGAASNETGQSSGYSS